MNVEFNFTEEYTREEVLNPIFLLLNHSEYKWYYLYFKNLNKPPIIHSLIAVQMEFPTDVQFQIIFKNEISKISELLQLNMNKPLRLSQNNYLFVLFNCDENPIIFFFSRYYHTKYFPNIGIVKCHPLTSPDELITLSNIQVKNARKNNCIFSVYLDPLIK